MTKIELISALAQKGDCTRQKANDALTLVTSVIIESLIAGEKIHLSGLGTFEIHDRKAKATKNPRNGKPMTTPARKAPAFRAAKSLKEAVNTAAIAREKAEAKPAKAKSAAKKTAAAKAEKPARAAKTAKKK